MSTTVKHSKYFTRRFGPLSLILLCSLLTILFYSCQKASHENFSRTEPLEIAANAWLDSKKTSVASDRNQRVEQIRQLLDYSASFTENADSGKIFLVIPLKPGFKSAYNNDKNPRNYLLLTKGRNGKIQKGNIVQIVTDAATIPANTFNAMETLKKVKIDASFTFLSIFDRYLYNISYKKGFITSFTEASTKRKQASGQSQVSTNSIQTNTMTCVDWWLITTVYYTDGSTDVYETFLGTTCTGGSGCLPNEWCVPQPEDPGGGGGGEGGGTNETDYEYDKKRSIIWTVYNNPGIVKVESLETVKGKPNNEPTGGTFTAVSHNESYIAGMPFNWTWLEAESLATASGSNASFEVGGMLTLQFFEPEAKVGTNSTTYSACFP